MTAFLIAPFAWLRRDFTANLFAKRSDTGHILPCDYQSVLLAVGSVPFLKGTLS
ncbi:MAG TPA: hypothetical protein VLA64_08235 [Azonexus sp.]|nr:hypothetical protein [Azonexus sp.]